MEPTCRDYTKNEVNPAHARPKNPASATSAAATSVSRCSGSQREGHVARVPHSPIRPDVCAELARATIARIHVRGALSAPAVVKEALADRIG